MSHRLHVDGADDEGAWFRLECLTADCVDSETGECNLRSHWDELGGELIDRDGLIGPPLWDVYAEWSVDDAPEIKQFGFERCPGHGDSAVVAPEGVCVRCGSSRPVGRRLVRRHNRPEEPTP